MFTGGSIQYKGLIFNKTKGLWQDRNGWERCPNCDDSVKLQGNYPYLYCPECQFVLKNNNK